MNQHGQTVTQYVLAASIVLATLATIIRTGAYVFAATGDAPEYMDALTLQRIFRKK